MSNFLIASVLGILFLLNFKREAFNQKRLTGLMLIFSFILSGIAGILAGVAYENIFRYGCLLLLVASFPLDLKWDDKRLHFLLLGAGIYLLVLQAGSAFGIGFIENFMTRFYPVENNQWGEEAILINNINEYAEGGASIRYGGIFYNPNIMGQTMAIWYIIMRNFTARSQKFTLVVIIVGATAVILSGSRTAFIVFFIYNLFFYWKLVLRNIFALGLTLILVVTVPFFLAGTFDSLRIFNISQGVTSVQGSGTIKLKLFTDWLAMQFAPSLFDLKNFTIGSLNWNVDFDNDPGYVLSFFGFVGSFLLLIFLVDIFRHSSARGRLNFVILFIGIGATIIMNFRFSILLFLVLSAGYRHYSSAVNELSGDRRLSLGV